MKLTLMIEGSAAAIAAVIASLPEGAGSNDVTISLSEPTGNAPTTGTATTGTASMPGASAPMVPVGNNPNGASAAAMPSAGTGAGPASDDDDEGTPAPNDATDANGLPWDERIHASTRTKTAKGVWKRLRGVDDDTVAAVEAQLRGQHSPSAAPVQQEPVVMPMSVPMPTAMPAAAPAPEQTQPAADLPPSFTEFMSKIADLMAGPTPRLTTENLIWLSQQVGVNAITDLQQQPEKIGQAIELLKQYNLW